MFTNLIMLVAALFMALSKTAKSFEMILVERFLYGIGSGMSSCPYGLQGLQPPDFPSQGCLYSHP